MNRRRLEAMRKLGKRLPVTVQVTLQESGHHVVVSEIGAALTTPTVRRRHHRLINVCHRDRRK